MKTLATLLLTFALATSAFAGEGAEVVDPEEQILKDPDAITILTDTTVYEDGGDGSDGCDGDSDDGGEF